MTTRIKLDGIAAPALPSLAALARACFAWIRAANGRTRQRRALATLDDRALRDIGLARTQANLEAAKPWWCG